MRPKSYIGITGFMSRGEVDAVLGALPEGSDRLVMIGVLASSKTLRGEANKWPGRYPVREAIGGIFTDHVNALNLIHFNTKDPENLFYDMSHAYALARPRCHGFQLNIAWPDTRSLGRFRLACPDSVTIVLQCGGKALAAVDRDPSKLTERIKAYGTLIDYVLVDPSGGLGQEFDEELAFSCLDHLTLHGPSNIGIGIAGGLHASNLDRLHDLLSTFGFSIDAEGRLRDAEDSLDLAAASAYLAGADAVFREYEYMPTHNGRRATPVFV